MTPAEPVDKEQKQGVIAEAAGRQYENKEEQQQQKEEEEEGQEHRSRYRHLRGQQDRCTHSHRSGARMNRDPPHRPRETALQSTIIVLGHLMASPRHHLMPSKLMTI